MTYKDAVAKIADDYKQRVAAYEQAEVDLFASDREFAANERALRDLQLRKVRGEKIDEKQLSEVIAQNKQLRQKLGLVPPSPKCKKCGDKGLIGGKFCECAVTLALSSRSDDIGVPLHDFAEVDFSVYGEQAETYRKLFSQVEKICSLYPDGKKRCLVLSGLTGTGKTYLAGCAARKVMERGLSVVALTAFAANNRFREYHTCFDSGKEEILTPLLDCTLLVIDDLGTESILRNVTLEYLYQVINERNLSGKLTLITTNLTPQAILTRYGERIYSRLFDKSIAFGTFLKGIDLRKAF